MLEPLAGAGAEGGEEGGEAPCDAGCVRAVQQVRAAFARAFGLGLGGEAEPPPLLRLNLS